MSFDDDLLLADRQARADALDVTRSFIVQAPAGSGKTELLIQRYLKLLATVDEPEEVLAITFTRKAAAEMRLRVLEALQRASRGETPDAAHLRLTAAAAGAVLERDAQFGWGLITHSRRMRIQTLDALNASLARMQPLTQSNAAGSNSVATDSALAALYAEAAAATLDWIGDDSDEGRAVEEVLLHVDNNTGRYVDYLSRMLRTRDQWLPFVRSGISTAEDARSLRDTLELSLQRLVADRLAALRQLLPTGLSTALRELTGYAAGNLRADGKLDNPICQLIDAPDPTDAPQAEELEALSLAVGRWLGIAELLLTKSGGVRKRIDKNQGFPPDKADQKKAMTDLIEAIAPHAEFVVALNEVRSLPPLVYSDDQWSVLLALFRALPVAVGELQRLCVARGSTDHIEIAISASAALGTAQEPGDVALLLDYQVRHILVDEMQDTSKAQYRMLEALSGGWQAGDGRTLFCVGDPMQSIYRFRNAEVSQFLLARENGIGSVQLEPLLLRRNFRSGEHLVDWYNRVFPLVLPSHNDAVSGAVTYAAAVAADAQRGRGEHHIHPVFGSSTDDEADTGCSVIRKVLADFPDDTVAVLVRSRTRLPTLLARLREAGIAYQAVDIDRLGDLAEVIDALALTRALVHYGDRVAWLALLRSPWVGLDWTDLHRLVFDARHATVVELLRDADRLATLSSTGRRAAERFLQVLSPHLQADRSSTLARRVERAWFALGGPALLPDENAVANVYHFFAALGKLEAGGTIADIATLEEQLDDERASTSSTARVQIMTMHKAKGLQFDHVILYALGRHPSSGSRSVLSWFDLPDQHGNEDKIISPIGREDEIERDPIHRFIEHTESTKDAYENGRLLYVACTRAQKTLHLIGNVGVDGDGSTYRAPRSGSLLRLLWPAVEPEFARAFAPDALATDDEDTYRTSQLRRFERPWELPEFAAPPGQRPATTRADEAASVEYEWVGPEARLAGTVAHRWLQHATEGKVSLDPDSISETRATSERWLRQLGAGDAMLERICERVEQALTGIVSDPRGSWLIEGDGDAELALQGIVDGRVESIIIDRLRIDEDDTHWIVDYKTSSHEGGNLEGFLRAESDRYREQLRKYRSIYRAYSGYDARTALYFPLLQRFVEVDV